MPILPFKNTNNLVGDNSRLNNIFIDGIIYSIQRGGGISVYFSELIRFLNKNPKIELHLNMLQPIIGRCGIEDILETVSGNIENSRALERYRSCYLKKKPDVFHSSYYRLPSIKSTPTVVTVHDFIYERYIYGARRLVHTSQKNAAIRAAQAIICVSESTKQDLLKFVGVRPDQSVYVIHNGVADLFKTLDVKPTTNPYILFVGQRSGYKNFNVALSSMTHLPDFELYCVGGGAFSKNEMKGIDINVAKRVHHLGFVTDEELNILYNRAVCLVYPSSYEGFGIPVIEAMRAGCPVVCVNCKAVLEVGGDALTVVDEPDPRLMANAILNTSTSDRATLIQRGLKVASGFSWETTHNQTLEVYRSVGYRD